MWREKDLTEVSKPVAKPPQIPRIKIHSLLFVCMSVTSTTTTSSSSLVVLLLCTVFCSVCMVQVKRWIDIVRYSLLVP